MEIQPLLVISLGYLLGSISWAYIIGRTIGKIDIREAGDGHISAAALHKRMGLAATMTSGFLDFCMGALTVIIAKSLNESQVVIMFAGLSAMIGHNWPIFLRFHGGLGASIIQGVLAAMVFWPFIIGAIIALISQRIIRKTDISTLVWVCTTALVLLIQNLLFKQNHSVAFILYPLVLIVPMYVKSFQISHLPLTDYVTSYFQRFPKH